MRPAGEGAGGRVGEWLRAGDGSAGEGDGGIVVEGGIVEAELKGGDVEVAVVGAEAGVIEVEGGGEGEDAVVDEGAGAVMLPEAENWALLMREFWTLMVPPVRLSCCSLSKGWVSTVKVWPVSTVWVEKLVKPPEKM